MGVEVGVRNWVRLCWIGFSSPLVWAGGLGLMAPVSLNGLIGSWAFQGGESVIGHHNCKARVDWAANTPIQIAQPLAVYPTSPAVLDRMMPGACLAIHVRGEDSDLLKPVCAGCLPENVDRIGPVGDSVFYQWSLQGSGELMSSPNNTVYYRLPREMGSITEMATVVCRMSDSGQKAPDASISGSVQLMLTWLESEGRIRVRATILQPVPDDTATEEVIPQQGHCRSSRVWDPAGEIQGSVDVPELIGPGQVVLLSAMYGDGDRLELTCAASDCGPHKISPIIPDDVSVSWSDNNGGGSFIFGNLGRAVLYRAPLEGNQVTITMVATDSGTMAGDPAVNVTRQVDILDLEEVNHNRSVTSTYRFVTVGKNYTIMPAWSPLDVEIIRVRWELDLGGEAGIIVRDLEKPNGMSPKDAALKLTRGNANTGLSISWKQNGHRHGLRSLKCTIYAKSSDSCSLCMDDTLALSNFLEGPENRRFKLFFDFKYGNPQLDDGGWRENRLQAEDRYGVGAKVDNKKVDHWFSHWAADTYGPCNQWVDAEGFELVREDPFFFFAKSLTLAGSQNGIFGLYDHDEKRNIDYIRVSRKVLKQTKIRGFRVSPFKFAGSDKKRLSVGINLPGYDLDKVESFCKIVNHEIAHWVADQKNWRVSDGTWFRLYGPRRKEQRPLFTLKGKSSKSVKVTKQEITDRESDTERKYRVTIEVKDSQGELHRLVVTRGWFEDSKTLYSEMDGYEPIPAGEFPAGVDRNIRNGLIIVFASSVKVEIYERPNDPDNDWIPNRVEDQIGTIWNKYKTHANFYHPKKNDREFWAEWLTRNLVGGLVDPERDWANPGWQTQ